MYIVRGQPDRIFKAEIIGTIAAGAAVMPGVTGETDNSSLIVADTAAVDVVGIIRQSHTTGATTDHDPAAGTIFGASQCEVEPFLPGCEVAVDLIDDASNDVDVASATSTVITITSLEDDIDGSWVYVRAGTGIGQLGYIKASASGNFTLKSAMTTTLDSSSKVLILRPKWHLTGELNSTAVYIKSTAAAGTNTWGNLRNEFKFDGLAGWVQLDPTKHHNLQSLNSKHVIFRQIKAPRNTFYSPVD